MQRLWCWISAHALFEDLQFAAEITEDEVAEIGLSPLTINNRFRHLSIIAHSCSLIAKSLVKPSNVGLPETLQLFLFTLPVNRRHAAAGASLRVRNSASWISQPRAELYSWMGLFRIGSGASPSDLRSLMNSMPGGNGDWVRSAENTVRELLVLSQPVFHWTNHGGFVWPERAGVIIDYIPIIRTNQACCDE